jgi:hypothetical protein
MAGMKLQRAGALSASLAAAVISAAQAAPSGQDILTRAAAAAGLSSYSVPAHFDVKMHRPISMRSGVDGTAYFKAPAKAAIAITHVPGPLGSFFKGSYTLDMLPQTWPSKYVVTSVEQGQSGGTPAYLLRAVPKNDPTVDHVTFGVAIANNQAISAQWSYKDGSSVALTIRNAEIQGYALPQSETISVAMPKYNLDATATYGQYSINAPVSDSVFSH